jgi:AcrR family transcriptional regulator
MDRRIQKTKNAIQDAYFSILSEKKTSRVTIAEIARKANIDRKTFYLHYNSIEDFIREFSKHKINDLIFALKENNFFEQPFDVVRLFSIMNTFIEQDIDFYRHIAINENCAFFWDQIREILISFMRDVYSEMIDLSPEHFDIYACYISTGFITIYQRWLKKEISISLEELGRITGEMTYFGIQKILPATEDMDNIVLGK